MKERRRKQEKKREHISGKLRQNSTNSIKVLKTGTAQPKRKAPGAISHKGKKTRPGEGDRSIRCTGKRWDNVKKLEEKSTTAPNGEEETSKGRKFIGRKVSLANHSEKAKKDSGSVPWAWSRGGGDWEEQRIR